MNPLSLVIFCLTITCVAASTNLPVAYVPYHIRLIIIIISSSSSDVVVVRRRPIRCMHRCIRCKNSFEFFKIIGLEKDKDKDKDKDKEHDKEKGERCSVLVPSNEYYVDTGVIMESGSKWKITAQGEWIDWRYPSGPDGYDLPYGTMINDFVKKQSRASGQRLFTLIASFSNTNDTHLIPVGSELVYTAGYTEGTYGRLYLFANDWKNMYWDNYGFMPVTITPLDIIIPPTPPTPIEDPPIPIEDPPTPIEDPPTPPIEEPSE